MGGWVRRGGFAPVEGWGWGVGVGVWALGLVQRSFPLRLSNPFHNTNDIIELKSCSIQYTSARKYQDCIVGGISPHTVRKRYDNQR
jgi:hypothetical protein